jgi:hypothetical protein
VINIKELGRPRGDARTHPQTQPSQADQPLSTSPKAKSLRLTAEVVRIRRVVVRGGERIVTDTVRREQIEVERA